MVKIDQEVGENQTGERYASWALPTLDRGLRLKPLLRYPELFKFGRIVDWEVIMNTRMDDTTRRMLEGFGDEVTRAINQRLAIHSEMSVEIRRKAFDTMLDEQINFLRVNKLTALLGPVNEIWGYRSFDPENPYTRVVEEKVGGDLYNVFLQSVRANNVQTKDVDVMKYREAIESLIPANLLRMMRDRLFTLYSVLEVRRLEGKNEGDSRISIVKLEEAKMVFAFAEMTRKIIKSYRSGKKLNADVFESELMEVMQGYNPDIDNLDEAKLWFFLGSERMNLFRQRNLMNQLE